MSSAFGKVILLGEHAVVYGYAAIAGAIDRRAHCAVEPITTGPSRLDVPDWNLSVHAGDGVAGAALERLIVGAGVTGPVAVNVRSDLPPAAGLGSSAALSVACARALCEHAGSAADVEAMANDAERCFHDNPSGIDVALAAHGGLGVYVRGQGLTRIAAQPLAIAVGLTGRARNTADMVRRVRDRLERNPSSGGKALRALGDAADRGKAALEAGDDAQLGRAMLAAQDLLAQFGLTTPEIETMVKAAADRGALGAKLTGAGGGGAVIALFPGRETDIVQVWRDLGFEGFVCRVGVTE